MTTSPKVEPEPLSQLVERVFVIAELLTKNPNDNEPKQAELTSASVENTAIREKQWN